MNRMVRGFGVASGTTGPANVSPARSRCKLHAERAVAPAELELEVLVELVSPPTVARADERGERVVIGGRPRLVGEELLQELLHRSQRGEVDGSERVAREVRHGRRCEPAARDLMASRVTISSPVAHTQPYIHGI